ncbi:NADPH-dependent FMN reductase [Evansella cellulosilytica]|uniref:NADPH-dependent FMN reductase n=1 Tax=Evansella cellulosilytica (strain ATCC 21833 / DSM 2522 / FERM P-1141 / JCM 9156 / N-4) TaxID=649639 RepID=E6TV10_EVAC2|nr:NAD(P)H-dependent oxidoreductase [Evansella cellulosilytica]ADU28593.1 NADPH-dependent FMN reductase [Evansella cellulosilytica DSM 2522]
MTNDSTIVMINGSMSSDSFTKKLLENVEDRLNKNGQNTTMIDVRELHLEIYDPDAPFPTQLEPVREQLREADGVIVGAPEYHGSYTGAIKNFLDYLGFKEFEQTPIALLTTTGGLKAGTNTLNHLRLVFRNLHGIVIPQQFAISNKEAPTSLEFDENINARLEAFVNAIQKEVVKKQLYEEWKR